MTDTPEHRASVAADCLDYGDGGALVSELRRRGHTIKAVTRSPTEAAVPRDCLGRPLRVGDLVATPRAGRRQSAPSLRTGKVTKIKVEPVTAYDYQGGRHVAKQRMNTSVAIDFDNRESWIEVRAESRIVIIDEAGEP